MTSAPVYGRQEAELLDRASATPSDANVMLALGKLQHQLVKYPEAADTLRRAIVLAPDDPRPWIAYANLLIHVHDGEAAVDMAFHRAAKLGGTAPGILVPVIEYFANTEKHDIALNYLEIFLAAHPTASPKVQRRYVAALRLTGRTSEAVSTCRKLVGDITTNANGKSKVDREALLINRARLLLAAGLRDEVEPCLEDCARRFAPRSADFDTQAGVLPYSSKRLASFQSQLQGRDVFLFLPGPSALEFVQRAQDFKNWNFVAATIAGYTEAVEETLLAPIDRRVDLLFMSNPGHLRCAEDAIISVLERSEHIALLAQEHAFLGYDALDAFHARFGDKMLWVCCGEDPSTPSAPLQILGGNSLSAFLPILVWGQPSRIFLFGADGGATKGDSARRPYFFAPDTPTDQRSHDSAIMKQLELVTLNSVSVRDANRRFQTEAREADEHIFISLAILKSIFDLSIPPIFNCCIDSVHAAFPKVSIDDTLRMKPTFING